MIKSLFCFLHAYFYSFVISIYIFNLQGIVKKGLSKQGGDGEVLALLLAKLSKSLNLL